MSAPAAFPLNSAVQGGLGRTALPFARISFSSRSTSVRAVRRARSLAASSVEITVSDRSFVWIRVAICVLRLAWVDGAHRTSLWSVGGCQKAVERARVTHRIRRIPLPLLFLEVTRVRAC